jgi:hypothetical protein
MNTNQFHSAASRRLLNNLSGVSGGQAAHSVEPSSFTRTIGGMGTNVETNPVVVHDDEGRMVAFPNGDGSYRPAHFEVVHSTRRDPDIYEANSFRLKFSKPLKYVFAIEVLEINVPNVDTTAPADREFLLLNGLYDAQGKFRPQDNVPKDRSFHTMITHNTNDPGVVRSSDSNDAVDRYPYDDYALGRYKYDASATFQFWCRSGWHRKTWFPTPIPTLDYLDLSLADANGTLYDIDPTDNWSATLQIFSKQ